MSRARNSQARSGRQPESLPPRLPEDVYNTRMRDLLELEPSPNDGEWDRGWSTALKRLWHRGFRGCIETRTLDSRSTTFCVEVDVVPERPLSLVLSATMRTPYSKTKVKAAVDKWMPKGETAEEQEEEEEDGVRVASSKASGMSAGSMQPSTSLVRSKTTTSSLRRGIRRPDYVIEIGCSHIAGNGSTSVPLIIEIKAFPLSDSGHPQSELDADKAFVRGLSQTAMYALAGWEMFRYRRGLFICGPTFSRVFVLDDNALAVEVASPPASLSALRGLVPSAQIWPSLHYQSPLLSSLGKLHSRRCGKNPWPNCWRGSRLPNRRDELRFPVSIPFRYSSWDIDSFVQSTGFG
ncbi:hypothetical protein CNBG_4200 [Cryptococcus deuterogattii R265]|uniref:uncharacterized protein n=1 Tax=Cryptococcus deuterogattii (strain R265) TaxID=294750 RepID=UPI001937DBDE|nr:hypothetical protein CNBG_4200 [Cryptococcus deuterogattii R265]